MTRSSTPIITHRHNGKHHQLRVLNASDNYNTHTLIYTSRVAVAIPRMSMTGRHYTCNTYTHSAEIIQLYDWPLNVSIKCHMIA